MSSSVEKRAKVISRLIPLLVALAAVSVRPQSLFAAHARGPLSGELTILLEDALRKQGRDDGIKPCNLEMYLECKQGR